MVACNKTSDSCGAVRHRCNFNDDVRVFGAQLAVEISDNSTKAFAQSISDYYRAILLARLSETNHRSGADDLGVEDSEVRHCVGAEPGINVGCLGIRNESVTGR